MPTDPRLDDSDLRRVAQGSYDGQFWLAADGALKWTNAAVARITGYSAAECLAMEAFPRSLVLPDDLNTFDLFEHWVAERRIGNDLPFRLLRKDESVAWVTASWQPLYSESGHCEGVHVSIRDRSWSLHNRYLDHFRPVAVETLKDVMAVVPDLDRVYRLLTERASRALGVARVGVWLFDETGTQLVCADRFSSIDYSHLSGASIAVASCPTYIKAISGDQLVVSVDALKDPLTAELVDGYLVPLGIGSLLDAPIVRGGRTIGVLCHEHVGHPRNWYETELAFVESLSDFLTLALELSERATLLERNRMLASIMEALPDPVVTVSLEGMPIYLNRAAYQTHEPRQDSGISEFDLAHVAESYSKAAWKYRTDVIVPSAINSGSWSGETQLLTRQGDPVPVWQTMVSHHDAGGDLRFLTSIFKDLRPQKQIEYDLRAHEQALESLNAQLEARVADRTLTLETVNQNLETFAFSVAHDLKAPLRGIRGFARHILEDHAEQLPREVLDWTRQIQFLGERMSQQITDLLTHSRLANRELVHSRFCVDDVLKKILAERQIDIEKYCVDIVSRVRDVFLEADLDCFERLLNNLIDNAIKYTSGVIQPTITVEATDTGEHVRVSVKDNGVGFDMQHHDYIFGLFQRLENSQAVPGTGIGLAIVRKAAERLGGRVWADSAPGKGASFTVELPARSPGAWSKLP